jgi:hypothetical protein
VIAASVLTITLAGCDGDERDPINDVNYGMTKAKVKAIMGQPRGTERPASETECWYLGWLRDTRPSLGRLLHKRRGFADRAVTRSKLARSGLVPHPASSW